MRGLPCVIWLALFILMFASAWKVFVKAGKPGWAAIIPIYNVVVLLEIVEKPLWWIILYFVPLVNIVVTVLVSLALAEKFGRGTGFGIGLWLLPIVFYPILAFGSATYRASGEAQAPPMPPSPDDQGQQA